MSGSMVWNSSSMPSVKEGLIGRGEIGTNDTPPRGAAGGGRGRWRGRPWRGDNPAKIGFSHRVDIGIGSGVHKVNGIGNPILHGEFDGVEVVAEGAAEGQGVPFDPRKQGRIGWGRIEDIAIRVGPARVIGHDANLLASDDIAAEVSAEVDSCLQNHGQGAGRVVSGKELIGRFHFIDVFPAAAEVRLQERGESDVVEDLVPIQRINEVAHRLRRCAIGMFPMREHDRMRDRDPELGGERIVKELIVGRPPERVVDDLTAIEGFVLQPGAVERDIVRDAIDEDVIAGGLGHEDPSDLDVLGANVLLAAAVDFVDQSGGEGVFHAVNNADALHGGSLYRVRETWRPFVPTRASRDRRRIPRRRGCGGLQAGKECG